MGDCLWRPFHIQSRHRSVSAAGLQNRLGGIEASCIWRGRWQRPDPAGWRGVWGPRKISAGLQEIKSWETQLLACRRCWCDLWLAGGVKNSIGRTFAREDTDDMRTLVCTFFVMVVIQNWKEINQIHQIYKWNRCSCSDFLCYYVKMNIFDNSSVLWCIGLKKPQTTMRY